MSTPHMSLTSNPTFETPVSSCIAKELPISKAGLTIMAFHVNSVASLIEGLRIADKTSEVDGQVPGHSSSSL